MLLRLAPIDPRSLIQGDYMLLRYAMANSIPKKQLQDKGDIVVSLDENDAARFIRIYDGGPLQAGEHLLFYRNRGGPRFGAESFFFQEGYAASYAPARYGELSVDKTGASVLVGLRGEDLKRLGRKITRHQGHESFGKVKKLSMGAHRKRASCPRSVSKPLQTRFKDTNRLFLHVSCMPQ
jgi:uncharacterized membrane-anchored protein